MISSMTEPGRVRAIGLMAAPLLCVLSCAQVSAQTLLSSGGGPVHLVGSDLAVLEAQDVRKEINCNVTPEKPALGFDLRFHAGFSVTVPLKELAGTENLLTILFRVIPDNHKDDPMYFTQRVRVPSIEEDAKGDAYL